MLVIEKKIPYHYGETIKIKTIADIHYGHALCDVKALEYFLADSDKHTYFVGVGDFLDSIVVTDKRYRKSIDAISSEEIVDEQIDELYKILEPYKKQFINISLGNHEDTIVKKCGTNPAKRLAEKMGVPYTGYSCFIKLIMSENGGRGRTVIIHQHHGFGGGGRTSGGDLSKFARDASFYIGDIHLYGHVHRLQFDEIPRLGISGTKLIARPTILVICGTFKKSLTNTSTSTWEETMGFPPSKIGGATINIKPNNTWVNIDVTL